MTTPARVNKLKEAMQGMAAMPQQPAIVIEHLASEPVPTIGDRAPSRRGNLFVPAYVNPAAAKQLRLLAVETDSSTQALIEESLNDLFRKYNRSAVA